MGFFGTSGRYQQGLDQKAVDLLQGVHAPTQEELEIQLQKLVEQGELSPEEAQVYLLGPSAMEGISLDPRFKNAQLEALQSLKDISSQGGLTSTDRSRLNQIQTEEDSRARGARERILQSAAERGISGSGVELLNNLTNSQESATRSSQRGFDVAADAEQRALEALKSGGALGAQMEQNQFGQQEKIASAIDRFNQANQQTKQTQANLGVQNRNTAAAANLQNKQNISNQNVDLANKQIQYNKELAQQRYENELKKQQSVAGALQKLGANTTDNARKRDDTERKVTGGIIQSMGMFASDKELKEDVEEFNPSEFLNNLTSYKYNYKNPKFGEGNQVGVMAQDLEKAAPQMVEDTPEGKLVDYSKAGGPLFASMADLHQRLKKLEGEDA